MVTNGANSVSVLSNNGDGTFAPAVNYTVRDPESVAVGDFNGDGKADLAVATGQIDGLDVLVNNGDGTFASAVAYNPGYVGLSVAVGDFNKDGKLDLVEATGGVSVLLGNGNGTFQAAKHYTATNASLVAVGDFCGKGNLDLAVASTYSGTVSVLQGNGNGTFQPPGVAYTVGTQPYSMAVGDFNGDGNLDLAVANYGSNNVSVLLGNGDCTFQDAVNYAAGLPKSVAVGDFNGDGKLDLAVANYLFPTSVLLGNGDGTFQTQVLYEAYLGSNAVAVGDFNGDGRPDLVSALSPLAEVAILMNATLPTTSTVLTSSLNPSNVNQSVTLTAAVTASKGIPTGTVTFQDGTSTLGTVTLSNGTATFTTSSLAAGTHSITAVYSGDSNFAGSSSSVLTQTVNQSTPSVTFTGAPASAAYQSTFTVTATTNASTTAAITASGACSIAGNTVTMTSGTGICSLMANWAADTNYSAASLTQSTTAAQIAPTVTFTGAPPTAAYQSTFTVTATTNASTTAAITASGACSITGNTVTMTSGTGICSLMASWAADANYATASLSQYTVATKAPLTVTANNATRQYGQANPTFTGIVTGLVNGDNITATYSTTATPTSTVGSYAITPTLVDPGGKLPNYAVTVNNGTLTVTQATPVIAWTPASIQLGYPLGAAQLDATANVPGTFTYTPPSGTAIMTTSQTLSVLFTPTDTTDYTTANMSVPLTVTPGPLASVSPSSINFGTLYLGAIVAQNVTVTNVGNAPMTITDPIFSILHGGDSNEYGAVNLCPKSLAAGKSCTIAVGFVAGPFYNPQTATLSVRDNAPGSPQTVALSATVINPQATLSASSLSFGKQKVNTSTVPKAVTLKNTGGTALTITSIAIGGTNSVDFTQTNNCPGSLAVNAICTMDVTFTPTAVGSRSGNVVITDNTRNSPQIILLSGTGN